MSTWKRICCAIDGSGPSRDALEHAVELAVREGAALHVLHVQRGGATPSGPLAPPPPPPRVNLDEARKIAGWIEDTRRRVPGVVVTMERSGDPATEIVAYAEEWECDVVVLGSHARRGLQRLILGSVAEEVARRASCPVLIVPARRAPPGPRDESSGDRGGRTAGQEPTHAPLWNP